MDKDYLKKLYSHCTLCPRRCGIDRYSETGFCRAGTPPRIARAALHMWEEPILSENGGSGAVFFSGCTLRCIFCQNHEISAKGFGRDISIEALADIFLKLQDDGAQNIDLITASHYLPSVIAALDLAKHKLRIPVVYNCGGYENVESLRLLDGYVDIYLPDIKYYSDELAVRYSAAPNYFKTAIAAVDEMIRQVGRPVYETVSGDDCKTGTAIFKASRPAPPGIDAFTSQRLIRGVIIRHMVLPSHRDDSIRLMNAIAEHFDVDDFLVSIMSQYTPFYKALTEEKYKEVSRRITSFEYDSVVREALKLGMNGFMQEKSSAKEEYTPSFNLEGVPEL